MSETAKRILSGSVLISLYIFAISFEGWLRFPLFFLIFSFSAVALHEFYSMSRKSDIEKPFPVTGFAIGAVYLIVIYFYSITRKGIPEGLGFLSFFSIDYNFVNFVFLFSLLFLLIRELISNHLHGSLYSVSVTLMGMIYVPFTFSHIFLLDSLDHGPFYIWMVSWATFMTDTFGYFTGKAFGRHKVGLHASPNKTYEGYIGGYFGTMATTSLFYYVAREYFTVPDFSFPELAIIITVIFFATIIGDLTESLIKRNSGVKDSGKSVPGMGGMLDTLDAIMFTMPGSYYIIIFLQRIGSHL